MILEQLVLQNFRQYYGQQVIEFAKDPHRNVTVIHGENGSGKTALLNALTWCLYGTIDLPKPERLLNERAAEELLEGQLIDVSVMLRFTDRHRLYTARRVQTFMKVDGSVEPVGEATLDLEYTDENGEFRVAKNPQVAIDQILPERMRTYFFFDGERIDNLSKQDNTKEIVEAIRNVMGLEVVERGLKHLESARRDLQAELKRLGDPDTRYLIQQREQLEGKIQELAAKKEQHERNERAYREEIKAIDQRLRSLDQARQLQDERDRLTKDLHDVAERIAAVVGHLREHVSRYGHRVFFDRIADKASELLEASRARGEIPSRIKEQFVQDLLAEGRCICGRDLPEGSEARRRVQEWLQRAGNVVFEDVATEASVLARRLPSEREQFLKELRRLMAARDELSRQKESIRERLDEISAKLVGQDPSEVTELEQKRRSLESKLRLETFYAGECQAQLNHHEQRLVELDKQISKLQQKQAEAALAQRRLDTCREAYSVLSQVYDVAKAHVREEIERRVNDIFREFLRKDFYVDLTDTYELIIRRGSEDSNVDAAMSQGERQVASLSFIGGLVAIAKERSQRGGRVFRGGVYPVVMDSPFGTLDKEYRRNVARGLPNMANQVVVLVSSSQWSREVAEEMGPRVGREYRLNNHPTYPEYTEVEMVSGAAH